MAFLVMIPVGYLLGAIPFGLILGWLVKRVDVRDYGSGKTGMTNVLRTVGVKSAALALLLDMGKSILAVALTRIFFDVPAAEVAAALAALIGHNWPAYAGFRGGRGTAPGLGGLIILSPWAGLVAAIAGVATIASTRWVSLGSILGTLFGVITLAILIVLDLAPAEYIWYSIFGGSIVIGRHWDNIQRLVKGEERKIGESVDSSDASPDKEGRKGFRWPKSA
jgi:glycerol-3-phosphate acyltransferase PlsY